MTVNKFIEFMNLYLSLFDICALVVLSCYIIKVNKKGFFQRNSNFLLKPEFQLGLGLLTYILGHFWLRGWSWIQWYINDRHNEITSNPDWFNDHSQIPMFSVGIIITTIGLIFILRPLSTTVHPDIWYYCVPVITLGAIIITWWT
jgi:hypothetical protein